MTRSLALCSWSGVFPPGQSGNDDALWPEIYRRRLTGRKLTDWVASAALLGTRSVVVPKAAEATALLLGREPRGYREYVVERARTPVTR